MFIVGFEEMMAQAAQMVEDIDVNNMRLEKVEW